MGTKFITEWRRLPPCKSMALKEAHETGTLKDLLGPAFGMEATVKEVFTPLTFSAQFDNSKTKKDLGMVFKYPTYRHGLAALMLAMDWEEAKFAGGDVFVDTCTGAPANVDGGYARPPPSNGTTGGYAK